MADYDAFLLVSFGGPEGPDEVMPFLQNVTRGRGIPPERLEAVAAHYDAVGGVSPINQQCRDLIAEIGKDFATAGVDLPIYWGNRNWDPYLSTTVAEMAGAGVRRALAFVTSAYGSYSSCRRSPDRQNPALLQQSRLHRAVRGRDPAGHRLAAGRDPRGSPPGLHGAQCAGDHGRRQRAATRGPLPGPAG
jgi:protoheme ferro-lyase